LKNIENAKRVISETIKGLPEERDCPCQQALKYAIITDKKLITKKIKQDLSVIIGKYMK
jgi:5'-methylthioadenosine phosphorylase